MSTFVEIETLLADARKLKDSQPAQALEHSLRAKGLAEAAGERKILAHCLLESGYCRLHLPDFEAALADFARAYEIFKELEDSAGQAETLNEMGVCWGELSENSKALESHLLSLALWQTLAYPRGLSRCLSSIGNRYYYFSQYDQAMNYYQQSLAISEEINDLPGMANCYNNLGIIYDKFGNHSQAEVLYQKSIDLNEQIGNTINMTNSLLNLSEMQNLSLHQPALAQKTLERALYYTGESNKLMYGICLKELGCVTRDTQQYAQADDYYQHALRLFAEIHSDLLKSELLIEYAKSKLAQHDPDSALDFLKQSLELASVTHTNETIFLAHHCMSEAYEQKGDYASALYHYKEYHRVREAVFSAQTEVKVKGLQVTAETDKARHEAEIFRLKHDELSKAHRDLQKALEENEKLLSELQLKTENLLHQVWEDSLTRIYNRRYLEMRLTEEYERAVRFGHNFSIAILDIDNFKTVNDQLSHLVGDQVLKIAATLLVSTCRSVDIVGRYGGDEFILLLLETNSQQAMEICERVRNGIEQYKWKQVHPALDITISVGICSLAPHAEGHNLIARADANLYQAKRTGKNRVIGPSNLS